MKLLIILDLNYYFIKKAVFLNISILFSKEKLDYLQKINCFMAKMDFNT